MVGVALFVLYCVRLVSLLFSSGVVLNAIWRIVRGCVFLRIVSRRI